MEDSHQNHELLGLLYEETDQFQLQFSAFHTFEQSQFFQTLTKEERLKIYTHLEPSQLATILAHEEMSIDMYLLEMKTGYASEVLKEMPKDDVVSILRKMPIQRARHYLKQLPSEDMSDIVTLFQYADDTAGALMTTEYVTISATQSVQEALEILKKQVKLAEMINYIYVVDINECLVGVVSLRDLLASDPRTLIPDIMTDKMVTCHVSMQQEEVAQLIRDYDLIAVPIVTDDDKLVGIVTVDDIIDVIAVEAVNDYSGLAGVDVEGVTDNVMVMTLQRLPWLLTLIVFAIITAFIVMQHRLLIEHPLVIVGFLTVISGTAGNAGTQALAVSIRRIATKEKEGLKQELVIGMLIGALLGGVLFVLLSALQQPSHLVLAISLGMTLSVMVANSLGSILPIACIKLGLDPSIASGPLIHTLCDVTSVLVYVLVLHLIAVV